MLFGVSLAGGTAIGLALWHIRRRRRATGRSPVSGPSQRLFSSRPLRASWLHRPECWLAVRCRHPRVAQAALGLCHPHPCTWTEGLAGDQRLFIAPPVNGWILITGSGLPEPGDDIDVCFRFLRNLGRKLGQVQLFSANRVLYHHAWVRLDGTRVVRAYAWAGTTLWNQGPRTAVESELGLKCFPYLEVPERPLFGQPDILALNTEKVPLLAARWSLDPASIDAQVFEQTRGVAGEPSHLY